MFTKLKPVSFLLLILTNTCFGMNYQFSRKLYNTILSNYTKHLKPRDLNSDVVDVDIALSISAIINYDEKAGVLTFQGKFTLKWWDELIMWNKNDHGNIDMIQVSIHDVWIPKVVIDNSVGYHSIYKFDNYFDSELIYVTYLENGEASISSSGVWETTCNSDVTKFPFDQHQCEIQLKSLETEKDVNLITGLLGALVNYTSMHSEFKIKQSIVKTGPKQNGVTWSRLAFGLILHREPVFMLMNMVLPVYIISVSNLLVFLLPLDSSDRVAFAVTMMLTFTVFMTMVTEQLPATDSLSMFNSFLLIQMVFSSVITICVLILHYLYTKDEDNRIPRWLSYLTGAHRENENEKVQPFDNNGTRNGTAWKTLADHVNKILLGTFSLVVLAEFIFFFSLTNSED